MNSSNFIDHSALPAAPQRPPGAPTPLGAITIIDFTHFIAGPFASMMLADFGAKVIKVEQPGNGDAFRRYPPHDPRLPHQGAPFLWANRNKQSVAIDLKTAEGIALVRKLIAQADVVMENFSTGVMTRFGLDYEACRSINPKIIFCSISAYGREGAFSDRVGFDSVVQAEIGFTSMNGYPDRDGVRTTSTVMDIGTAMMACNGVLAALYARKTSGIGQAIEIALFDAGMSMVGYSTMQYLLSGIEPSRNANASQDTCPTDLFQASDGPFFLHCGTDAIFRRLVTEVLERPDLAADPRFANGTGRLTHRDELRGVLQATFRTRGVREWQQRFRAAGVPSGEARTIASALASDEVRARGLVSRVPHETVGWLPNIAGPIRFAQTPVVDPVAAPAVGQHTAVVLKQMLGCSDAELAALEATAVIQSSPPTN